MKITRILVPTDFSGPSREATDYALELASLVNASVLLYHVIEDPVVYIPALGGYLPKPSDFEKFSETALANWISEEDTRGVEIGRHWEHGHPVPSVLEFAKKQGCDLIVMGTHGRGNLGHLLMGNVAERVVRQAKCPVLTVHPTGAYGDSFDPSASAVEG